MDGYRERRECPQPDEISEIFRRWRDFFWRRRPALCTLNCRLLTTG